MYRGMKSVFRYIIVICFLVALPIFATGEEKKADSENVNIPKIIFSHIEDEYWWHIIDIGDKSISLPLPVIVYSSNSGLNIFMSSKLEDGKEYNGLVIGNEESGHKGKIIESLTGERPLVDISITKNVLSIMFSSILLVLIILLSARWYKKHDALNESPSGIAGVMEPIIMMVHGIAKDNIGEEEYRKYSPYLITVFLFILLNNLMGIIPVFPGGANVTGNIAVTLILSLLTFLIVNLRGTKHYYKEIFNPDVPGLLKPVMSVIETFSAFMKPLSLTIRLFANMLAGHIQILCIVSLIFVMAKYGSLLFGSMTVVSVAFGIFLDLLEILVSFIQAYVFTMLSSIYIGIARQRH
jgi:hypothetical protein